MTPDLRVQPLPPAQATDLDTLTPLCAMVNKVYAQAEAGLWQDGAARTTVDELSTLTRAGELVVAILDSDVVACLRLQHLTEDVSSFSLLATAPEHQGKGIATALIDHAEAQAEAAGRHHMRLELLVPQTWTHPTKEALAHWYTRTGYHLTHTTRFDEDYPHLAPLLATPCDYRIYHKRLL